MFSNDVIIYIATALLVIGFILLAVYYNKCRKNLNNPATNTAPHSGYYWVGLVMVLLGWVMVIVVVVKKFRRLKEIGLRSQFNRVQALRRSQEL
jgi:protein-S-isoprenylcysteine O-methyltransferase Ste14